MELNTREIGVMSANDPRGRILSHPASVLGVSFYVLSPDYYREVNRNRSPRVI